MTLADFSCYLAPSGHVMGPGEGERPACRLPYTTGYDRLG